MDAKTAMTLRHKAIKDGRKAHERAHHAGSQIAGGGFTRYSMRGRGEAAFPIAGSVFPPTCDPCAPCQPFQHSSSCVPCSSPQMRRVRWGNQVNLDELGGHVCFRECPPNPCYDEGPPERVPTPPGKPKRPKKPRKPKYKKPKPQPIPPPRRPETPGSVIPNRPRRPRPGTPGSYQATPVLPCIEICKNRYSRGEISKDEMLRCLYDCCFAECVAAGMSQAECKRQCTPRTTPTPSTPPTCEQACRGKYGVNTQAYYTCVARECRGSSRPATPGSVALPPMSTPRPGTPGSVALPPLSSSAQQVSKGGFKATMRSLRS